MNENNILNVLEKDIKRLEIIIKNKKIYIPFIGASSAGKSTILNDIVGYPIFPESGFECTTRGIILQYSFDGSTELYNCKSKKELDFYSFEPDYLVSKGITEVYNYIYNLNSQYSRDEQKCFFILKTPIKFFEKFDDDLKKHICLIDLPGGDTNNNRFNEFNIIEERTLYEKLLCMSCSFIFINKGRSLGDGKNINILKKSFKMIPNINQFDLLKCCLFVINMFGDLKEDELDKNKLKNEIIELLINEKNDESIDNTNVTYFDALAYKNYLKEEKYFIDINYYLKYLHKSFTIQNNKNNFFNLVNLFNKNDNFITFCLNEIKKKVENLTFENEQGQKIIIDKKIKCDKKIKEKIEEYMVGVMNKLGKEVKKADLKKIDEFANIYEQINKNLYSTHFFKKSNNVDFFNSLSNIIYNSTKKAENEYKEYLKYTIAHFNDFFSIDIKNKKNDKEIESIQIREEFFSKFNQEIEDSKNNINKIFDDLEDELKNYKKKKKTDSEIKNLLKKNNNDLEKSLNIIYNEMNDITNKYTNVLEQEIKNLNDKIEQIRLIYNEKINSLMKNKNSPDNIFNDKLLNSKDIISINSTKKKVSLVSLTLGIGGSGILATIFGITTITGVGLIIGSIFTAFGLVSYLFSPSAKKKFIKAIDKTLKNLKKNLNKKKREFLINFNDFYSKLKDNYENSTSLQISDLEGVKIEKFNESKEKFFKAKNLLLELNES